MVGCVNHLSQAVYANNRLAGRGIIDPSGETDGSATLERVTTSHRPPIDHSLPGRTFKYDLSLFHGKPQWGEAIRCWKQMFQVIWFPNIFWLVLCSGAFLGIFVMFGAVFAGVLVAPPYNFSYDYVGFVFAGQVVVSLVVIPLQGYLSDFITKFMSRRNNGVAEVSQLLRYCTFAFLHVLCSLNIDFLPSYFLSSQRSAPPSYLGKPVSIPLNGIGQQ